MSRTRSFTACVALATALLFFCAALPANAQAKRAVPGPIKVPADHPRILFTSADIPALKERITKEPFNISFRSIEGRLLRGGFKLDSKNPIPPEAGLQAASHALSEQMAALAFYVLLSDNQEAVKRVNAFFEELDVSGVEKRLPPKEFMPWGEFLYGLAVAYDWAWPVLTPKARTNLSGIVRRIASGIFAGMNEKTSWEAMILANNHSMAANGPLGLAGLALWGEDPGAKTWVGLAAEKVEAYCQMSFDRDGAGFEGNLYGPFGLEMALPFAASIVKLGGVDLFGAEFAQNVVRWIVTDFLPGCGKLNPLNDSDGGTLPANLPLYAAAAYKDGLGKWLDENRRLPSVVPAWVPYRVLWDATGVAATPPDKDLFVRYFRGRGLVNVRTGFGKDDCFASFECGQRRNGCHGQGDQGHFTFYGGGMEYIIDTGYSNVAKEGSANQSVGHNLVVVNSKGQAICGEGKIVEGSMARFSADDVMVCAIGDLSKAYNASDYNPVTKAARAFIWVRTAGMPYLVIADDIAKSGPGHVYESYAHISPMTRRSWEGKKGTITGGATPMSVYYYSPITVRNEIRLMKFDRSSVGEHYAFVATAECPAWFCATVFAFDEKGVEYSSECKGNAITITVKRGDEEDVLTITSRSPLGVSLLRKAAGKKTYEKKL
jgi:hypothetical protein